VSVGDIIFVCALAAMAGISAHYSARIKTERMPMQWGTDGIPTWYASRLVGMWFALVFVLACRLLIAGLQHYWPDRVQGADIAVPFLAIVGLATHFIHLRAAARWAARQG
jgi:hypothetical protein